MNKFCSQCGKQLQKGILICPECGFKNKKKKRKRNALILIVVLIIILVFGTVGYLFRETLVENFANPMSLIEGIQDPDYKTKQEFKEEYEKYWIESHAHWSAGGINLTEKNAVDFDTFGYKVNHSTDLTTGELLDKRDSVLNKMEEMNCYQNMNIDKECNKLLEKYTRNNTDIWFKVYNKMGEWRFCDRLHLSDPRWDHVIPTCEAALNWKYGTNIQSCRECDKLRKELTTLSASIKNPNLAEDLLVLTEYLKNYDKIKLELTLANNEEQTWRRFYSRYSYRVYQIKQMTDAEVRQEFSKDDYSIEFWQLEGPISKSNLTKFYTDQWEERWDSKVIREAIDKSNEYSEIRGKLHEEITDYILILNGLYDLDLSTPY